MLNNMAQPAFPPAHSLRLNSEEASDVYSNMNKAERRQYGKTKFCDQMAKWFKKDFADRATLPTKKRARKVLWSWKKVGDDDGDDDGDYDDSGLCC